jgi:hypothetical protein
MGATSNFHVWDPQQECFILRGVDQEKNGILSIVGQRRNDNAEVGPIITRNSLALIASAVYLDS